MGLKLDITLLPQYYRYLSYHLTTAARLESELGLPDHAEKNIRLNSKAKR